MATQIASLTRVRYFDSPHAYLPIVQVGRQWYGGLG